MRTILTLLFVSLLLVSCNDEDDPIPLTADAGTLQNVAPLVQVALNGTASTGPTGFTYSWSYAGEVPESEINFKGKDTATPSFAPPRDGTYLFTLTISDGTASDRDDVTIFASGAKAVVRPTAR